ncbi:MAG TPA: hypothetical protein VF048_02860 [Gemmatimonadaceae bacterium]|jgi:hypothetical protein
MFRRILILMIGMAIGYAYGFGDAQHHDRPVTSRVLDRMGGPVRDYANREATVGNDDSAAVRPGR